MSGCRLPLAALLVYTATALSALVACGRSREPNVEPKPVDPDLQLAVVVPETIERLAAGVVNVARAEVFTDAAAWAAVERRRNPSFDVSVRPPDGDAWVLEITARQNGGPQVRAWYRKLGGGLAVTCTGIAAGPMVPVKYDIGRKVCVGVQRVTGGIFVPFELSKTRKYTNLALTLVNQRISRSVNVERVVDAPRWRFERKGADGEQVVLDTGTVAGGDWFLSGKIIYSGRLHYRVVARRKIGALDLDCHAGTYRSEVFARELLSLCTGLRKP